MPNLPIDGLPVATTPLAGTEPTVLVQGGVTTQTPSNSIIRSRLNGVFAQVSGGTAASANLLLQSTENATKGHTIIGNNNGVYIDESAVPNKVSLGTTITSFSADGSPESSPFTILQNQVYGYTTLFGNSGNNANGTFMAVTKCRGMIASPAIVQTNDLIHSQNFLGYDGTGYLTAASITSFVGSGVGAGVMPGRIALNTTDTSNNLNTVLSVDASMNTNIFGAFRPNNDAGISGQILTSAGAGLTPTWEDAPIALVGITNGQITALGLDAAVNLDGVSTATIVGLGNISNVATSNSGTIFGGGNFTLSDEFSNSVCVGTGNGVLATTSGRTYILGTTNLANLNNTGNHIAIGDTLSWGVVFGTNTIAIGASNGFTSDFSDTCIIGFAGTDNATQNGHFLIGSEYTLLTATGVTDITTAVLNNAITPENYLIQDNTGRWGTLPYSAPTNYSINTWTTVSGTSQSMAVANGYIHNNAGLGTYTIPTTFAVGEIIAVVGLGAGGWRIAQNASQNIRLGNTISTTGTGGHIDSTNQYDSVYLVGLVANTTMMVVSAVGNISFT